MTSDIRTANTEKDVLDNGTIRSESTMYDAEKAERRESATHGNPDMEHEVVEEMDKGHLQDLERQHVGSLVLRVIKKY